MMAAGRTLYVALKLLDRQLLDRDGRRCGKVDDLELEPIGDSDVLYVTAIRTGPGALLIRLGARRAGAWLERVAALSAPDDADRGRIPIQRVREIGNHLSLSLEAGELSSAQGERWVRDHVISHIPGGAPRAGE
jgi:sporulation protein YlmC with PRC-barrel domain